MIPWIKKTDVILNTPELIWNSTNRAQNILHLKNGQFSHSF